MRFIITHDRIYAIVHTTTLNSCQVCDDKMAWFVYYVVSLLHVIASTSLLYLSLGDNLSVHTLAELQEWCPKRLVSPVVHA